MPEILEEIRGVVRDRTDVLEVAVLHPGPSVEELIGSRVLFRTTVLLAPIEPIFNVVNLNRLAEDIFEGFDHDPVPYPPSASARDRKGLELEAVGGGVMGDLWVGLRQFTEEIGPAKVDINRFGNGPDIEIGLYQAKSLTRFRIYPSESLAARVGNGGAPEGHISRGNLTRSKRAYKKTNKQFKRISEALDRL